MSSPINLGFLRHSWRYFANNASFWKIVVSWIGDSCLFYKDFVLGPGRFAVISLWGFHRIQVQVHHIVIKMKILWARWKLCQEKFIDAWWYMFGPLFWELGSDLRGAWSLFGRYCEKKNTWLLVELTCPLARTNIGATGGSSIPAPGETSTFEASQCVTKKPLVGQLSGGMTRWPAIYRIHTYVYRMIYFGCSAIWPTEAFW